MYMVWREKGGDFRQSVGEDAALLASLFHGYKHPSSQEEHEVRAIHELRVDVTGDDWDLVDEGRNSNGDLVEGEPVRFRANRSSPI